MAVSNVLKNRVISLLAAHPIITINGVTHNAICWEDPMAILMAKSILFFNAKVIPLTCSAAFPTIGRRIKPTKVSETPVPETRPSILSTRNSALIDTRVADTSNLGRLDLQ